MSQYDANSSTEENASLLMKLHRIPCGLISNILDIIISEINSRRYRNLAIVNTINLCTQLDTFIATRRLIAIIVTFLEVTMQTTTR